MFEIYCDGGCVPNPGKGGYGIVIKDMVSKDVSTHYGGFKTATNNQMELIAMIESIKLLKDITDDDITILTDSQYVQRGLTEWINGWIKRKWVNVKNVELWRELNKLLISLKKNNKVEVKWVKAHNGNVGNELADKLATKGVNNVSDDISEYIKGL